LEKGGESGSTKKIINTSNEPEYRSLNIQRRKHQGGGYIAGLRTQVSKFLSSIGGKTPKIRKNQQKKRGKMREGGGLETRGAVLRKEERIRYEQAGRKHVV